MTRLTDADLASTVAIMEKDWSAIARAEGTLDTDYMKRSMQAARYRGLPVHCVQEELGLMRMQHIMIGETLVPGYNC